MTAMSCLPYPVAGRGQPRRDRPGGPEHARGTETVPLDELLTGMWQIRESVNGCDAAYVVLAQARDLTLVTADARLAKATVRCPPGEQSEQLSVS